MPVFWSAGRRTVSILPIVVPMGLTEPWDGIGLAQDGALLFVDGRFGFLHDSNALLLARIAREFNGDSG